MLGQCYRITMYPFIDNPASKILHSKIAHNVNKILYIIMLCRYNTPCTHCRRFLRKVVKNVLISSKI